ncbi:MAG: AzlD domain-containing protein [Bacillota bacterium]
MSITSYLLLILGMTLATYIPRMLPLVVLSELKPSPFFKRFLKYIPPAALSALIFPGILTATQSSLIALIGGAAAFVLAYFKTNLLFIVLVSIGVVYVLQLIV